MTPPNYRRLRHYGTPTSLSTSKKHVLSCNHESECRYRESKVKTVDI